MTVRTWFRLLRRTAWETELPQLQLYCRADRVPLGTGVRLWALTDYQRLIDHPELVEDVCEMTDRTLRLGIQAMFDAWPHSSV